jgi:glycosyltransferase involved in cell wall biosynthesis
MPEEEPVAKILMISKAVEAPWTDSAKNLVKDLVCKGRRHQYTVMVTRGAVQPCPNASVEPIYAKAGAYSPSVVQNLRVLARLFRPDNQDIYHFFFAPNPLSSKAAWMVRRLKPGKKFVQTVCSVPATFEGIKKLMFAHRVVALSRSTRDQLLAHGVENVVHIPPAVDNSRRVSAEARQAVLLKLGLPLNRPVVLYAGDYQFSRAADTCARALPRILEGSNAHFVFACRIKQDLSRAEEARIKEWVASQPFRDRVHFFNELDCIVELIAASTLQVLPAGSLFAKMDIPLVLLESLREGTPLLVSNSPPMSELIEDGAAAPVWPEEPEDLATRVLELLGSEARRRTLATAGLQLVKTKYDSAVVAAAYEDLYDELLGQAPKA